MYCGSCGAEREDEARFCKRCGRALEDPPPGAEAQAPEPPAHVENYLAQAILVTIFCCMPFGIVSIVYAAQVNGKVEAGDVEGAQRTSANAKMWAWIAFGTGLVIPAILLSALVSTW